MTVNFITEPSPEYDHALRTVMKSARGSVGDKVLAILTRGLGLDVASNDLRRWIQLNGKATFADGVLVPDRNPEVIDVDEAEPIGALREGPLSLAAFADLSSTWKGLVKAAEKRNLSSTSLSGDDLRDVRLNYARWMYAGLLVPVPAMESMKISGRANLLAAYAFVSKMIIEHETGWDRAYVAQGWLAVTLGWDTPKTAGRHLERLVELRCFTNPQGGPRVIGKYSLRQVSKVSLAKVKRYEESIVAYVDGKPDALAAIIRSVDHPIWGYSGVMGHEHRLVLMADAADIPVRSLGVTVKKEREIRKVLDAAQLSRHTAHRDLVRILDGLASEEEYGQLDKVTGELLTPLVSSERAWAEWRSKSDEWKLAEANRRSEREAAISAAVETPASGEGWYDDTTETAEIAQKVSAVLDDWNRVYPLPHNPAEGDPATADDRQAQFVAWILGLHGELTANELDDAFRTPLREQLVERMLAMGYPELLIDRSIRYIMEAPAGADYTSYLRGDLLGQLLR